MNSHEKRKCAIKAILRICKSKGKIFISVNSFESKHYSKFTDVQDITVEYKNKNIFYHLYKKNELENIMSFDCKIIKSSYECSSCRLIVEKN